MSETHSALCIVLNNNFALKKICGDYIVNYLIRNLSKFPIDKFLISSKQDNYESPIPTLNITSSVDEVSFLKEIKKHTGANNIILLPANSLYCKAHVIKKIILLLESYNIVVGSSKNTPHKITAFNSNKLGDYKIIKTLLKVNRNKIGNVLIDDDEFNVINNAKQLICSEHRMQNELRQNAINNGIVLLDPNTIHLSYDTKIESDVIIHPNVFLGPRVTIKEGASILSFSHIEDSYIDSKCTIGPFARIRSGTSVGEKSFVGNFVEIKNSEISNGVKIKHLSYVGNTKIGDNTNVGAGVVICNYDGNEKYNTVIDKNCFIGANSSLIAPIYIAERVKIAAGSTITDSVEEKGALTIARAKQVTKIPKSRRIDQG